MAQLFKIADARGEMRANAVFFHGLGGDAYTTWQADKEDKATLWPAWLAQDIEGLSVYTVGYEAPVSRWRGSAMHLTDRATNVLGDLLNERGLANGAFLLIGHSLGGLLIKQILRTAQSEAQNDEKAASFLRRVEKIAFLATPHAGADLAVWGDRLRILIRPSAATVCLVRNDPNLRDLNLWYRDWSNNQNITNLVLTETKPLSILGMIVKPDSSDPGLAGPRPRPMDYDHEWICKPRSRTSDIYVAVRSFIESPFERPRDLVAERLEKLEVQQKELAAQVARKKGVEVAPLLAVLVKLGEKGVREEDIPKQLDAKADELIKLRAENEILRRGQPALAAITEEVQALIDKGDFDAARDALGRGRETARTLRIDASRNEAALFAQEARVDGLELAYRSAASQYAEAASLVAPFDTEQQWSFLLSQAGELYKQGDEFGDNSALAEAIDICHRCLALVSRSNRPLDWAMAQNNLGNALMRLGERESGTARLEEAVAAYRDALKEYTSRAGAARLGDDPEQSRNCVDEARRARERDGAAGGGGCGLSRRADGIYARAGAAAMGDDPDQSRPCVDESRRARERDGAAGGGGCRLSRRAEGKDARAGAARLGADPEQSRHCVEESWRARERDGAAGGGGCRLSRRAEGKDARAGAAQLGDDPEQSRQCVEEAWRARERHGAAGGGGRGLSRGAEGIHQQACAVLSGRGAEEPRCRAHAPG
jgi:tetratricopeptide (TPR) repeat protein